MTKKNVKRIKREHELKGHASTLWWYNFNIFYPELQIKDSKSAMKSKLIDLLTQLKGFRFVSTLVLVFKKIEREEKTKYDKVWHRWCVP